MRPRIAITIGDFNGIGPEVIFKSLSNTSLIKSFEPILVGSGEIFLWYSKKLKSKKKFSVISSPKDKFSPATIPILHVGNATEKNIQIGLAAPDAGVCAGMAIERSVKLCLDGDVDAMVTAPVSKESLHFAGYNFPGQTEMLAMLSRSERVTMMLISKAMRVGLATIHLPLRKVAENIFKERIIEKLETIHSSLVKDFGIHRPSIAVLGLNPHSGEGGAFGNEEKEIISPAIEAIRQKGLNVRGPFSADGFFATYRPASYDAILAMYHDQGLIPMKMTGFNEGVNFSAGLKIVRTSPDHGTAFDIAGKGIANPGSMIEAIKVARSIALNRKK
jgi:4-hydroxythreonine-4-phosphate dehydrogenase